MHHARYYEDDAQPSSSDAPYDVEFSSDGIHPATDGTSAHSVHENVAPRQSAILDIDLEPTVRTRLLNQQNWDAVSGGGETSYNTGPTSPRPGVHRNYGSFAPSFRSVNSFGGTYPGIQETADGDAPDTTHALLGDAIAEGVLNNNGKGQKMSTTRWLAERHGVKNTRMMYV